MLVNGSLGRIVDFLATLEASQKGIKIGRPDMGDPLDWKGQKMANMKGNRNGKAEDELPPHLLRSPQKWPVVEFHPSAITEPVLMYCIPCSFEVVNADGEVEAKRDQVGLCVRISSFTVVNSHSYYRQVPLILACALSVHKSQGQTLERVRVDLTRTFEKGQGAILPSFHLRLPITDLSPLSLRCSISCHKDDGSTSSRV